MRIRRCAASVKCARRGRRAAEMYLLVVWFSESGDVAIAFADRECLELLGAESLGEDFAYTCLWPYDIWNFGNRNIISTLVKCQMMKNILLLK